MTTHGVSGSAQSKWILLGFATTAVLAAVMAFVLLDSSSDSDDALDVPDHTAFSGKAAPAITDAEEEESADRSRVLPSGPDGERVPVSGRLYLNGAPLGGAGLQAFVDLPESISPAMADRLRTSLFFYGAAADDLKKYASEKGLLDEPGRRTPLPFAECITDKKGSFSLALAKSETVTFGLDHDFYYLSPDQAGPHDWKEDEEGARLESFDGSLDAELGAMIEGLVTDTDEFPLEGVIVTLVEAEGGGFDMRGFFGGRGGDRFRGMETVTDGEGHFAFRGVSPGREYSLKTRSDAWAPAKSKPFDARPGQVHGIRFSLHEGASIQVTVLGPEGSALKGAEIFLEVEDGEQAEASGARPGGMGMGRGFFSMGGPAIEGHARTDEEGVALFEALSPGGYRVRAGYTGMLERRAEKLVRLTEKPRTIPVKIQLTLGHSLSGRVVDDLDRPVAGALVHALPHADRSDFMRGMRNRMETFTTPESSLKKAETGADGSFLMTGLEEGKKFDLSAEKKGLLPGQSVEIEAGSGDVLLVMDRPGEVKGRVISGLNGESVRKFAVRIFPASEEGGDRRGGRDRGGRDRGGRPGGFLDRFGGGAQPGRK